MTEFIKNLLAREKIFLSAVLPLEKAEISRPYMLEREGISGGSMVIFAIPYHTGTDENANISRYAFALDYHKYAEGLASRILPVLREKYKENRFALFCDRSPVNERRAAIESGLGIEGMHGLVITELYSSFVFLAEIVTDAKLPFAPVETRVCERCGECEKHCPFHLRSCLSEITQRKGDLSEEEKNLMKKYKTAWGCDICSEVCPYTKRAKENGTLRSPLPYFTENILPFLTEKSIDEMSVDEFSERAYSWRGKEIIKRNLRTLEGGEGKI